MTNHYYLAIVAPFGSGKTTLMKEITAHFKGMFPVYNITNKDHVCIEQSLELFPVRKEMDDFIQSRILDNDALNIQNAFKQSNEDKPSLFIGDSSYHEHYCYIMTQYKQKRLKSHHHKRLMFKFKAIRDSLPNPDMTIYVDIPLRQIYDNIIQRNREFETKMSKTDLISYITILKKKYDNLFLSRRNYKYDHSLLYNIHLHHPGAEHHLEHTELYAYINKEAARKLHKSIILKGADITTLPSEYKMKYVGGTRCK